MLTPALVVASPGAPFTYQDVELDDTLRDGEVLVEMKATGVCHTDLNFSKEKTIPGLFPAVLGHEGAGVVLKIGSNVSNVSPNDHVLITYASCGTCPYCARHETSFCSTWFRDNFGVGRGADGSKTYSSPETGESITSHFFGQSSFAKRAVVGATALIKVDEGSDLALLAPMGCGIQTGAGAMLNVAHPETKESVAVVGAGSVGLAAIMAVMIASKRPKTVIAVDILPSRLELAKSLGATHLINSKETPDLHAEILKATNGIGVEAAIDTTGRPDIIKTLLNSVAKKGMVVTVGVGDITAEVSVSIFDTVNSGRTYVGCVMGNCYPQEFIPTLIRAWKEGKFPVDRLVSTYEARDMEDAKRDTLSGKAVKAVLKW